MLKARYIKYGTMSGLLLLCAIVLSMTEDGPSSVYAQITPAPEKAGGSSSDTDGSTSNDESSGLSSGSSDDNNDNDRSPGSNDSEESSSSDSSDSVDSSDVGQETAGEQANDMTASEEETNPLMDAIMKKVTDDLTAVGITDLGF